MDLVEKEFRSLAGLEHVLENDPFGDPSLRRALDVLDLGSLQQLSTLGKTVFLQGDEPFLVYPYFPGIIGDVLFFGRQLQHPAGPTFILLLSADLENEPDTLGIIGASTALYFSDIPFTTPLGAVKVGLVNNEFVINPKGSELEQSPLNLMVAGNELGIIMIEAGALEVDEETVLKALELAQEQVRRIVQAQKELYDRLGIKKREFVPKAPNLEKSSQM